MSMINIYQKDRINIITISTDKNGVKTESIQSNKKARVELENKQVTGQNGQEVTSNGYCMIESDITIDYTSLIQVVTIDGTAFIRPAKKWKILKLSNADGFGSSRDHWEAWF